MDFSIFAEDEIRLTDNLNLTLGTRYNEDEDYGKHFSPRGYLVYKFNENFRLKGEVQTGYLTPKPNQRQEGYKNVAASGWGIAIGKSSLKPETSINYEIAAEYIDESLKASLSLFHIDFKDKIQNKTLCQKGKRGKPNTFGCSYDGKKYLLVYEVANVSKAKISGAELGIDYNILDNTSLNLSYTYTKSEQKSGVEKGKPLNDYPIHMLRVGINSDITKDLNLWVDFTYNGKIDNHKLKTQKGSKIITSYEKSHGGYSITDIGLNYKIKDNFTISAAVLNLFDKKFIEEFRNRDVIVYDGTRFQLGFNYSF
ncbi:TonB-dependent receptor domain-containing protein [Campylobacter ureolyticus]|uniref:TonB-dependent receptor domain-containing protein n=1 Tax=Campylobacter ureolyticus TaxID=827 RepID=UPI002907F3D6|nr:TonB-dependent receptor [Campylobacter ureolyticus]MDU5326487.1 TonB-dependent receptor [Campylobacter ureolyticus]